MSKIAKHKWEKDFVDSVDKIHTFGFINMMYNLIWLQIG